jgi:large subunit ribosomal protein L22
MTQKATAQLKYLHMAPRKVRLVASLIRGMHVREAQAQLSFQTQRAVQPITKLLKSALANAKQLKLNPERLIISDIRVDQGPMIKRMMPRAMGRGLIIQKKMSHIVITLSESDTKKAPAYTFVEPVQKTKKKATGKKHLEKVKEKEGEAAEASQSEKAEKHEHEHDHAAAHEPSKKQPRQATGFTQKFFRRKAGGE